MLDAVRQAVATGRPVSRAEAVWLYEHADLATLSELATVVRDRFHAPGRATYLIMAIINYTNICVANCDYCAFYTKPGAADGYLLTTAQVCDRIDTLRDLGGTLVGFNGGFHPGLRMADYARFFSAVHERFPDLAFYEMTVAEFMFYCKVSKLSYDEGAAVLAAAGTAWVTGGGAEILDEAFRRRHSPLKYKVADYYEAQRAIIRNGMKSTATMVIGFDETLDERMNHLEVLRDFQDEVGGALPSFLCWTYKPFDSDLGGDEVSTEEYLRWLAICRIYLHNIPHIRTSVLTKNEGALRGLRFGADDFDLPTEDEVTEKAGATVSLDFDRILQAARDIGYEPVMRRPF